MSRALLLVKTSSLGDVVHNMPAVHELRAHLPAQIAIDWVVEEAYAPLVALHPAVRHAIPVALRRWRHRLFAASTWREIGALRARLRELGHERVIDTQGLVKSALLARWAFGRRAGFDAASAREPAAAWFYDDRYAVPADRHAITRCRSLVAAACGYTSEGPIRYGLAVEPAAPVADRYAVLLHATARSEKAWPEAQWIGLARALAAAGDVIVLPYGDAAEQARSERIAAAVERAIVPPRRSLDAVARMLAGARVVVGVDTGLLHLAAALAVPVVAVFVATDPALTGPLGEGPLAVCGDASAAPDASAVLSAVARVTAGDRLRTS